MMKFNYLTTPFIFIAMLGFFGCLSNERVHGAIVSGRITSVTGTVAGQAPTQFPVGSSVNLDLRYTTTFADTALGTGNVIFDSILSPVGAWGTSGPGPVAGAVAGTTIHSGVGIPPSSSRPFGYLQSGNSVVWRQPNGTLAPNVYTTLFGNQEFFYGQLFLTLNFESPLFYTISGPDSTAYRAGDAGNYLSGEIRIVTAGPPLTETNVVIRFAPIPEPGLGGLLLAGYFGVSLSGRRR